MADQILPIDEFFGGIAIGNKQGSRASFKFTQSADIQSDPNEVSVLKAAAKVSGSTVDTLVKWIVDATPHDTNRYFYGESGAIFRETSGGTWSKLQTTSDSGGQGMDVFNDYLYYAADTQLGRYGPLSGTPTFTDNWQTDLNNTSSSNIAPVKAFKDGFAVGNGNDLGWYDGSTWDQNKVVLPPGFNIRTLEVIDEFLVVGAWRGDTVLDSEQGFLFTWDGSSSTFNAFVPTDGAPNAITNNGNTLQSVIGTKGAIFTDSAPFNRTNRIPKLGSNEYLEVLPGAMTVWRNQAYIGVSGNTDSSTVEQGVYSFGTISSDVYPPALNFAYQVSTGTTTGTTLKIGAVKGIGDELYFSWDDNGTYGVDRVKLSNDNAATAVIETLIFDNNDPLRDKVAKVVKCLHSSLASSEGIKIEYDINRSGSWTEAVDNTTSSTTETRIDLSQKRFKEIQFRLTLTATASTKPTLYAFGLQYDDLVEEPGGF